MAALIDHRERWEDVVQKLRDREMPPADEPQPPEHLRQAAAAWIESELARIDRVTPRDPGRVTARRLNRAEYNNTVRDLLGVDLRPADDFPQDDSGYGFDNIADVLSLSPALMEKYLTAAERVARAADLRPAVDGADADPAALRRPAQRRGAQRCRTVRLTGLSLPNAFHAVHRIPVDADYVIRVFLGGLRPANSEPISLALWVDDVQTATLVHDPDRAATFADDRQDFGGQTTELRVKLRAGDRRIAVAIPRIFEGLPARYGGPAPSQRPDPHARRSRRRRTRRRSGSRRCRSDSKTRRSSWRRSR